MARIVQDISTQGSLMVVNPVMGVPYIVREGIQLVSGEMAITERGWRQVATIEYAWANRYERDNLQTLPVFGLDSLLSTDDGWVCNEPQVSEISPTIHLYNIVVTAYRFTKLKPTT